MRFLSITYRHFGPFQDVTLDVSHGSDGLHLIYGPNEAGKTTALRGLGYFFFGFPHATCDDFRYRHADQRIGGTLRDRKGSVLACLRRRGRTKTLRAGDDQTAVDDALFREFLGGLVEEQFKMLFGLNYERLAEGGQEIISGRGGLGEALFAAGAGLAGLRRIDRGLQNRLEALYKPQGKNQELAVSLRELPEKRNQLKTKTLQIETWTAQERSLEDAIERQQQLEAERQCNREESERLQTYRAAVPVIGALRELEARLEPLKAVRLLRETFADEHSQTVIDLDAARNKRDGFGEDVARLEEQLRAKEPQGAILAEEQAIERLKGELDVCRKAERDRLGLFARKREHQGNARNILRNYFKRDDLKAVEDLRLTAAVQARIRGLGGEREARLQAVRDVEGRLKQLRNDIAGVQQELAATPEPMDLASVDALRQSILQEGPLERNEREASERLVGQRRDAESALKRLAACWRGTLTETLDLPIPSLDSIRQFQQRFTRQEEARRDLDSRWKQCETAMSGFNRQLQELLLPGDLPTESALAAARAERDAGVELVRNSWLGQGAEHAASEAFVGRHAPQKHLIDALQGSINHCDQLADLMRREANRVSQVSFLQTQQRAAEGEREALARTIEESERQLRDLQRQWREEWQLSGIAPKAPHEMGSWLGQFIQLRDQVTALRAAAGQAEELRKHIAGCIEKLGLALNLAPSDSEHSLVELLDIARNRVETARKQERRRDELENQLRTLQLTCRSEERNLETETHQWREWEAQWGQEIAAIGLTAKDEPTTAHTYLDQLGAMFQELREMGTIELRLKGMDRDLEQFLSSLNALRARLDGSNHRDSTADTMQGDVDALVSRMNEAKDVRTQRELLQADLFRAKKSLADANQRVVELEAKLQVLRAEAAVTREADIPIAIEQSIARRELQARIDEERVKLHQQARGLPLERFLADALAVSDQLEHRLAELQQRVEPLDLEINQQAVAAAGARRQLDQWREASADAADCQQELESMVAKLRDQASEYAALHLARHVLKQSIERFRQGHQASMLSRAGHFFQLLTRGAFSGLEVEEDQDSQAALICSRASPAERVATGELSDGTRDQLFLALRLAGIEQHLERREPMPLIVDDVLVNFDEDRARATLVCLAELAKQTQVLLFTHHAYLVRLAKESLPDDVVFCQNLGAAPS